MQADMAIVSNKNSKELRIRNISVESIDQYSIFKEGYIRSGWNTNVY